MNRFAKFKPQKGFGGNPLDRGNWWDMTDSMKKQAVKFGLMNIFSEERRILGITDKPIKHKIIKETKRIGTITKGDEMTFEEANKGKVNPFVSLGEGFKKNCQTCVAVFEARLKGFNIRAKAYDETNIQFTRLANNPLRAFINPNTRHHPEWPDDIPLFKDWKDCLNYTKNTVKRGQRYIMQFNWIDRTEGHVISVIRSKKGKFFFYDPQTGTIFNRKDFKELFEQIIFTDKYKQPKYIRVDNLQFDENVLKCVVEASDE